MKLNETIEFLNDITANFVPEVAVILGSGLNSFVDDLSGISVKYEDIPHFATSSVKGHQGQLLFCKINGKKVVIMQGRFHFYEGNTLEVCTYPIKVFKKLGVKTLILTNAAGAINKEYSVGDIVLINDHINFLGTNPLIGKNDDSLGVRFPDMGDVYNEELREMVRKIAKEQGVLIQEGVYIATTGPSYETKAEVKAFSTLGADVVGMSTVPEAIVANYLKMKTIAFSLVTNKAAGIGTQALSHEEVIEIGRTSGLRLAKLIKEIIKQI